MTNNKRRRSGIAKWTIVPRLMFASGVVLVSIFQSHLVILQASRRASAIEQLKEEHYNINKNSAIAGITTGVIKEIETTADNPPMEGSQSFEIDDLCGGCRWIPANRRITCGMIISKRAQKDNSTMREAAENEIATGGYEACKPCLECDGEHKQFWRPDKAAPTIHRSTTHYLKSIPENQHRVPRDILASEGYTQLTSYFGKPKHQYPAKKYLFEYNPSIMPLSDLPVYQDLEFEGEKAFYVASYRVSTQQSCFPPDVTLPMIGGSWKNRPQRESYLAIGLLGEDLSLLADVVVDLPSGFGLREDFRLFVLHNQLYLTCNCKIVPIYIGTQEKPPPSDPREQPILQPMFSSNLVISVRRIMVQCSNHHDTKSLAKNLNYFIDANNQTMFELNPLGTFQSKPFPHQVQPVDLNTPGLANQRHGLDDAHTESYVPTQPGFYTLDELELARTSNFYESPYTGDRGSACCIDFEHSSTRGAGGGGDRDESQKLLLGISHTKIPYGRPKYNEIGLVPNQYLSRFYAMEAQAPYRTVALSGYICLSQYLDSGHHNDNPLAKRPLHQLFQIGNMTLDCPAIHFVTGMIHKVTDPSTLIIAYGVGDCSSWFVEVNKQEVVDLLFGPPKDRGYT